MIQNHERRQIKEENSLYLLYLPTPINAFPCIYTYICCNRFCHHQVIQWIILLGPSPGDDDKNQTCHPKKADCELLASIWGGATLKSRRRWLLWERIDIPSEHSINLSLLSLRFRLPHWEPSDKSSGHWGLHWIGLRVQRSHFCYHGKRLSIPDDEE